MSKQLFEDLALLKDISKGDKQSFKILYDKYWLKIYYIVYKRLLDEDTAKDIVQDVFLSVWLSAKKISIKESILPYLIIAAKNRCISHYNKNKSYLERNSNFHFSTNQFVADDSLFEGKELKLFIENEISNMPENMRNTFLLSRDEGKTIKEIASELSLSEQTIKNNISKALCILRKRVKIFFSEPANVVGSILFGLISIF